jgi:hypothetical protein
MRPVDGVLKNSFRAWPQYSNLSGQCQSPLGLGISMQRLKVGLQNRALERGVNFIYRVARNRKHFRAYGAYFLCYFYLIASTSRSASLRRMAREMGRDVAQRWRGAYPVLPADAHPETVYMFVLAGCGADHFGPRDKRLKEDIRWAASRFSASDFLGFDPATEPPPGDLPVPCGCGLENPRGRKTCKICKKRLSMSNRYNLWMEALCTTYWFERHGLRLGARYGDVLKWLPDLRPYPVRKKVSYLDFFHITYAITHLVYTLNGYGKYKISPRWLPHEFEFLKANLKEAIDLDDPDMVGEFLDSLKAFGLSDAHPVMRPGIDYLLSRQNPDGSWGDLDGEDIFARFHATWTAIDGLRDYAWRGERLSYPKLLPLLREWAKPR